MDLNLVPHNEICFIGLIEILHKKNSIYVVKSVVKKWEKTGLSCT